jgi:hypothetical protein
VRTVRVRAILRECGEEGSQVERFSGREKSQAGSRFIIMARGVVAAKHLR